MHTLAQDAAAVRSVSGQLAEFQKSMEADGEAQRSECRHLVATATRRAGWLVDEVLQVCNPAQGFGAKTQRINTCCSITCPQLSSAAACG